MLNNNVKNKLIKTFKLSQGQKVHEEKKERKDSNDSDSNDTDTDTESDSSSEEDFDESILTIESEKNNTYAKNGNTFTQDNTFTHYASTLKKDIPMNDYEEVNVCIYKINQEASYPFTMFLLYKYDNNNLSFIRINEKHKGNTLITHVLEKCRSLFTDQNAVIDYMGFIEENNNRLTLVIQYTSQTQGIEQVTYNTAWWWTLPSEIINYKYILNFDINPLATTFLVKHNKLCLLYDKEGTVYETPEVGYYGNYYKKIAAVASLGLSRQGIFSSFGPFYYFSDYTHAMRNAFWSQGGKPKKVGDKYITVDEKGRYEKGGIVRFALFVGKTKMLLGRSGDKPDDSAISQDLTETNEFIKAMIKLRDNSAKWTEHYDSVRIGSHEIKLKDKPTIYTNPLIALKEYEQQIPLEYYFVDTSQDVDEKNIRMANIL